LAAVLRPVVVAVKFIDGSVEVVDIGSWLAEEWLLVFVL
jgi:hypothetical protein